MNAKILSSKKAFFWKNCESLKWIALAQCLILFISYPMMLLFANKSSERALIDFGKELMSIQGVSHNTFILLIFPVLVGLMSFRYLQNTGASVRTHSMPITRRQLMTEHTLSGLLMLILPYLLTTFIIYLVGLTLPVGTVDLNSLVVWCSFSIFFSAIFFSGTVFSGMIIGNSLLQGIFVYIMFLLPSGLNILISYHLNIFLKGYKGTFFSFEYFLSPMTGFLLASQRVPLQQIPVHFWVISTLYFIGFIGLSYWLYERRPLEKIGQTIQFSCLIPYLKGLGIFCSILSMGAIFKELTGENFSILIGFLLGAIVSYILFEMIIQKNLRCQLSFKYLALTIISFSILFTLVGLDFMGYGNKKIPFDSIQSAEFLLTDYSTYIEPSDAWTEDPNTLKAMEKLYEKSIDSVPATFWLDRNLRKKPVLTFGFKGKNGKWFSRQFFIDKSLVQKELGELYESHAYLETRMPYLAIEGEDIESLRISTPLGEKTLADPQLIQSLFAAMKKDIYAHPFAALNSNTQPLTEIYFTIPVSAKSYPYKSEYSEASEERNEIGIFVLPNYENTMGQIKKNQLLSPLLVSSQHISKILIKPLAPTFEEGNNNVIFNYNHGRIEEGDPDVIVISQLAEIEDLLNETLYYSAKENQDYRIRYVFKSDEPPYLEGFISTEDIPKNLLSH